ncbi:cold-shock protein [Shewanella psychrotolerans]|uniref:cold-shock protein n=1 Tax=Shewanella psychrotolerans TaxID=2864206 RepID=UPI001C65C781|nr:cold shock domain-containing protein [Shewanella psychrotolerans]QYK02030.1 cold shock domain-containing protein [Shewanella psychrotolerans]
MKGKVVSYLANKKYGFVTGEDGESYFLHVSGLLDRNDEVKLVKDVVIEFDPTPTPKGLAAKKVSIPTVYFKKQVVDFFTSKSKLPKHGNVEKRQAINTRFIKDFEEAREHIETLAREAGCNAILNLGFEKETFRSGNYKYTVHAFKGDFALVTDSIPCSSKAEETDSVMQLQNKVDYFDTQFVRVQQAEAQARAKQFETSKVGLYILIGIVFVGVLIAIT